MLCHLAHQFPPFIEGFLERSRPLRRRLREETVTDLLMGCLITAGGGGSSSSFRTNRSPSQMLNAEFSPHPDEIVCGHRIVGLVPCRAVLEQFQPRHHLFSALGRLGGRTGRVVAEGWDRLVQDAAVVVVHRLAGHLALDLGGHAGGVQRLLACPAVGLL